MNTKRQVFYSFHYEPDNWRAAQVRNMGLVEGNEPTSDNDWETISGAGDREIKRWINRQLKYRSCTVVLVGSETADRKWINYEIIKSWDDGMGVVGIYIHGLKNQYGLTSRQGRNPFDYIAIPNTNKKLSTVVNCYNPDGKNSQERYEWISRYLSDAIEEAIQIRNA